MTWESVLTIFLSGVFAAIVSGIISIWLQNVQHKNEYFKLLYQKRLDIYLELDRVIGPGMRSSYFGNAPYYSFMSRYDSFVEFRAVFFCLMENNRLYTKNTYILLRDLSEVIYKYEQELKINVDTFNELTQYAIKYHPQFKAIFNKLQGSIYKDLNNLHKTKNIMKFEE